MRGVYAEVAIDRVYAHGEAMRRVVGEVDADDEPVDGLELAPRLCARWGKTERCSSPATPVGAAR